MKSARDGESAKYQTVEVPRTFCILSTNEEFTKIESMPDTFRADLLSGKPHIVAYFHNQWGTYKDRFSSINEAHTYGLELDYKLVSKKDFQGDLST